jgi:hypothetical protein
VWESDTSAAIFERSELWAEASSAAPAGSTG